MPRGTDERAVSELVGAVLLFAFLFLFIALWQVQVVPQQNAEVEFNHNQHVQGDLLEARNAIVGAPGSDEVPSVSIDMAPDYQPRTIFFNPARPQAGLRTAGTSNGGVVVSIDNATVMESEIADFWTGSERTYSTGLIQYEPQYNEYRNAPTTIYENTLLVNRYGSGVNLTIAEQSMIQGDTITIIAIDGNLSRTQAEPYSLDFESLSVSDRTIAVTNETGQNLTVSFPTRLNASRWNESFAETGELVSQGGHVVDVRASGTVDSFNLVTVELERGTSYTLRMAKVGVGRGTTSPEKAYIIDVPRDSQGSTSEGSIPLVVEVRDKFNNPVSGVTVRNNSTSDLNGGSLDAEAKTTDTDGRATFEFSPGSGMATIEFNISDDATVTANETVTFNVSGGNTAPSLSELSIDSTSTGSGQNEVYDTVVFDYSVSDESAVSNITVRLRDKDGNLLDSSSDSIDSMSGSGTIQFENLGIAVSEDIAYEIIVYDDTGNTETDTGIVPKP